VGLSVGLGADRDFGAAAADLVQVEEVDLNFIRAIPAFKEIYLGDRMDGRICHWPAHPPQESVGSPLRSCAPKAARIAVTRAETSVLELAWWAPRRKRKGVQWVITRSVTFLTVV
jgi:hypothetical protein